MRHDLRPPLRPIRLSAERRQVLMIHAIDTADDTRLPRPLALLDATTRDESGEVHREQIAQHALRGYGQQGDQEARAIRDLCAKLLNDNPPSSAKDGVSHPLTPMRTRQQPKQPPHDAEQP